MEGPTLESTQPSFNNYNDLLNHYHSQLSRLEIKQIFRQFPAFQPPPTEPRKHIAGGGKESNLDSLGHICKHRDTGPELPSDSTDSYLFCLVSIVFQIKSNRRREA